MDIPAENGERIDRSILPVSYWHDVRMDVPPGPFPTPDQTMQTIASGAGNYISFHTHVANKRIAREPIQTSMSPPLAFGQPRGSSWYPQLSTAYLLQLPYGIIGDHVLFDRHGYYGFDHWWLGSGVELYRHATDVVEVYARKEQQDRNYWGLSQAAGLEYWAVKPDNFDFDKPGMEVCPVEVCNTLETLLLRSSSISG